MAELAVVGIYVNYWLPQIPTWVSAAFFLVAITVPHLLGVKIYGEFEFWFAIIKVAAVIGMIVLGLVIIVFGVNNNPELPDPSFVHLIDDGGFAPFGLSGIIASIPVVVFSFGGLGLIGITGEMSPFVQIFDNVGVIGAAHLLNFVVITAVLSVYNSGLYSNGRVLYSLASQGNAPRYLLKLSPSGVPVAGVMTSSAITAIAVVVVMCWPEFAFKYLMSVAVIAGVINWSMIMVTQYKFRQRIGDRADDLTFKLPGGRVRI